jgi:hypothetical protein
MSEVTEGKAVVAAYPSYKDCPGAVQSEIIDKINNTFIVCVFTSIAG